ncbi:MAG: hypothetical protein KDB14_04465 [Planctomycetales bacterium]|nr:hypothetical protein [Planctomycetales bacterium]
MSGGNDCVFGADLKGTGLVDQGLERRRWAGWKAAVGLAFACSTTVMVWQAWTSAPVSDEASHLAAGIATLQTGDPGYYRVNPPLHRVLAALPGYCLLSPRPPLAPPASAIPPGQRLEHDIAVSFAARNERDFRSYFRAGRLFRILLLQTALAVVVVTTVRRHARAALIAAMLCLGSPMYLGHGWTLLPDGLSAAAMVALLLTTIGWLERPTRGRSALVGAAWGGCMGTKFTFCPLFVVWPLMAMASARAMKSRVSPGQLLKHHLLHGFIALLMVWVLYGGRDIGTPLGEHQFESQLFGWMEHENSAALQWLRRLPSPFPKQFLVGIDEQKLDLEEGFPTYVLGVWYPNGNYWYYLFGLIAKESVGFCAGLVVLAIGAFTCCRRPPQSSDTSAAPTSTSEALQERGMLVLCLANAAFLFAMLSANAAMALNVRYLFPALPCLWISIGIVWPHVFRTYRSCSLSFAALTVVLCWEFVANTPHFFAYASPLVGGAYRVPAALHDTNFDGGQDLWRLESWLQRHPPGPGVRQYVCIHTRLPQRWAGIANPPPVAALRRLLDERLHDTRRERSRIEPKIELIALRGLGAPAPWNRLVGESEPDQAELLQQLLQLAPDEFLSPTVAIYRSRIDAD